MGTVNVLTDVGAQLKLMDKTMATAIRKNIRTAVSEAGTEIVAKARSNASWSSRIPDAIRMRVSFSARGAGVSVVASKARAPHGRPYEMGSKGTQGELKHPVFGNRKVWVSEAARPFFFPAVRSATPKMIRDMDRVISDAAREAGFKGE